jgi:hypothetical protein
LIAGTKNFCPGTRMARSYKKQTITSLAGIARSYGCPAITSDLASVVCSLSRMAITNDLAVVFGQPSQMASSFTSRSIKSFTDTGKIIFVINAILNQAPGLSLPYLYP